MMIRLLLVVLSYANIILPPASLSVSAAPIELDVHLPLRITESSPTSGCPYSEALRSNLALRRASGEDEGRNGTEQIDFFRLHSPHVTLYLTRFDVADVINGTVTPNATMVGALLSALSNSTSHLGACEVSLNNYSYSVSGSYAMWSVLPTPCLRDLSDAVVDAASPFMSRPPIVPDWVKSLPEPQRSERMKLVEKYGSPNVLGWFVPHVTVGYDTVTPVEERIETMENLRKTRPLEWGCAGTVAVVRVGRTGIGGTVLQVGAVGDVPLLPPGSVGISRARIEEKVEVG